MLGGIWNQKSFVSCVTAAILLFSHEGNAATKDFKLWIKDIRQEAVLKGVSRETVEAALPETLQPIPKIIQLDRKQPEKTKSFNEYKKTVVSDRRVRDGRSKIRAHSAVLDKVSARYGVEPQVIVALWGIETNFGQNTGGFDVVSALATLAHDGRRSAFFHSELMDALKILDDGHIHLKDMKGSWAGAMGQSQFMPSSFLRFAQDYNGDGRRDIWTTEADVFASAANYLMQSGWRKGQPWGREVRLPADFDAALVTLDKKHSLQFWHDKGVRLPDGKSLPFEGSTQASLVQPGGKGGPVFLVYDNYRVIMKWNKSTYFATSVGLLSDEIKG